jgi:hypothetical protein
VGKFKTIAGFVGVVAALTLWHTYAPGAWVSVWGAIASLFSTVARF